MTPRRYRRLRRRADLAGLAFALAVACVPFLFAAALLFAIPIEPPESERPAMGKKAAKTEVPGDVAGLDAMQRAARKFTDRPRKEVTPKRDLTAGHWAGMPEYRDGPGEPPALVIRFTDADERQSFVEKVGMKSLLKKSERTWSARWPNQADHDTASLRFAE